MKTKEVPGTVWVRVSMKQLATIRLEGLWIDLDLERLNSKVWNFRRDPGVCATNVVFHQRREG